MNAAELQKARQLSAQVAAFGRRSAPVKKKQYAAFSPTKPKEKDLSFMRNFNRTPVVIKSTEAPSTEELAAIIEPLVKHHIALQPAQDLPEITPEFVKEIVKAMHALPENDKLEVSKGIRNASSFIYGGTKYGTHELMHGGAGSSSSTSTQVYGEVVSGSGTSWTLAHTPDSGTLRLYAAVRLTVNVDYTLVGTTITTVLSYSSGALIADYSYA